jgi:protein-S-isoprenylcysteine O-methyltransferase Ste14
MRLLNEWGFTRAGLVNNQRGEFWVLGQFILLLGFVLLPVYRLNVFKFESDVWLYCVWLVAAAIWLLSSILLVKGLLDLGRNLTPLPYPKEDGELIQSGVYGIVRHPLYSGLILAAIGWAIFQLSLTHLLGAAVMFIFFDAKASREEIWLSQKYPEYSQFQQRVKKLIPWL